MLHVQKYGNNMDYSWYFILTFKANINN